MSFIIKKEDFENLKKIESMNEVFFNSANDYVPIIKRKEAKELQKPIWDKMSELKNDLSEDSYFNERFDIIVSRPNKQSTKTVKGYIRRVVWISLVNYSELNKKENAKFKHVHFPQLQVSFQPERFIVASVWLEGNNSKQIYREKFLEYLKNNRDENIYKLVVYNTKGDKKVFDDYFHNLSSEDYNKFLNSNNYSLGLCKILEKDEALKLKDNLYSLIVTELQILNEDILTPCFGFRQGSKSIQKRISNRAKRKAKEKSNIKDSLRKGTEPTTVTKKHEQIQKTLTKLFKSISKGTTKEILMEKDFVDIRIEDPTNNKLTLFEIKTDKSALNCIKHGLGQLLFYSLIGKNDGWSNIELVIVGLNKMNKEAKEFVKSIKKYLGAENFRYQKYDEKKKILLEEKRS